MSGTVLIQFRDKESFEQAQEWFKKICPTDRFPDFPVPNDEGRLREIDIKRGLYIEFEENSYCDGKYIMSLDYAIWDDAGRIFADMLAQEICKKFPTKKAGWCSIGFVSMKEFLAPRNGVLEFQKRALKKLEDQNADIEYINCLKEEIKMRKKRIKYYTNKARELVNGQEED